MEESPVPAPISAARAVWPVALISLLLLLGPEVFVRAAVADTGGLVTLSLPLDVLIGPIAPVLNPDPDALKDAYNNLQLTTGQVYADQFPVLPGDLTSSNFYDLALSLYTIYYRTNNPSWRDRARFVAQTWRDSPDAQVPTPRGASTLGLAILAVENNDAQAKAVVLQQAAVMRQYFSTNWFDARENGYSLMVFLCAHLLGDGSYDNDARAELNLILANQSASGAFIGEFAATGLFASVNYMSGVLMEALIMYDRVFGDPRIVPAMKKWADWEWSTQWVGAAQGFQYADRVVPGWTDMTPFPNLNGLFLPAWAYLDAKTADPKYLTQGTQILQGHVHQGGLAIWGEKQFSQMFRSSSRYFGLAVSPPSDVTPPTVRISAPTGGNLSGNVIIMASASDSVGVTLIKYDVDGALIGAFTPPVYSAVWNTALVPNGTHTLTVTATDAAGNTGASAAVTVTVANPSPVPVLSSLAPSSVQQGGPAFTLSVTGANFVPASVVQWNGSGRTTTFVSATQLTASIPASDIVTAGTSQVTVFTPAPGGGTSNALPQYHRRQPRARPLVNLTK